MQSNKTGLCARAVATMCCYLLGSLGKLHIQTYLIRDAMDRFAHKYLIFQLMNARLKNFHPGAPQIIVINVSKVALD